MRESRVQELDFNTTEANSFSCGVEGELMDFGFIFSVMTV